MTWECGSCTNFSIIGTSYTVELKMPQYNGEDNKLTKNINRFNFWSGGYRVHDEGINTQPLILQGVEFAACDEELGGACFAGYGLCFPICSAMFQQRRIHRTRPEWQLARRFHVSWRNGSGAAQYYFMDGHVQS